MEEVDKKNFHILLPGGRDLKKRLTAGTMLIVVLALLISGAVEVWTLHQR